MLLKLKKIERINLFEQFFQTANINLNSFLFFKTAKPKFIKYLFLDTSDDKN